MTSWNWYRSFFEDARSPGELTLDYATLGFLRELRETMLERMSPVSEAIVIRMTRQRGINKRTLAKMLATLVEAGLIYLTDAGYWCDIAERELAFREEKSEKISKRNAKVSRNRWQKAKQNQSHAMPDKEEEKEGYSPSGNTPSSISSSDIDTRETDPTEIAPSVAPVGASGASVNATCHDGSDELVERLVIRSEANIERVLEGASDELVIVFADQPARQAFKHHLRHELPEHRVERLMELADNGLLTAEAVHEAVIAAISEEFGNG